MEVSIRLGLCVLLVSGCGFPSVVTERDATSTDASVVTDTPESETLGEDSALVMLDVTDVQDDANVDVLADIAVCGDIATLCNGVACGQSVMDGCNRSVRCGLDPCVLDAPLSLFPPNGYNTGRGTVSNSVRGAALRPVFRWRAVTGAATYEVQWTSQCPASDFASCSFTEATTTTTPGPTLQVQPMNALDVSSTAPVGRRYFWRVRACRAAGCGPFGAIRYVNVGRVDNDFNGDGYGDFTSGAPGERTSLGVAAGTVYVSYGSAMNNSPESTTLDGTGAGDTFGSAVSSAGDINADGFADLLVGAPLADPHGSTNAGTVSVFLGAASGISQMPTRVLEGLAGDELGTSVAAAGDINGDGLSDIAMGAPKWDVTAARDVGAVFVYMGRVATPPLALGATLQGTLTNSQFGVAVSSAGDTNGDGFSDLLVGAPETNVNMVDATGLVYVYSGSPQGVSSTPSATRSGTSGSRMDVRSRTRGM